MDPKSNSSRSVWSGIRSHLQNRRDQVHDELSNYPPPVAGCNQHFNYLLEQRSELALESARLAEAESASLRAEDPVQIIEEFLRSSTCLEAAARKSLLRLVKKAPKVQP